MQRGGLSRSDGSSRSMVKFETKSKSMRDIFACHQARSASSLVLSRGRGSGTNGSGYRQTSLPDLFTSKRLAVIPGKKAITNTEQEDIILDPTETSTTWLTELSTSQEERQILREVPPAPGSITEQPERPNSNTKHKDKKQSKSSRNEESRKSLDKKVVDKYIRKNSKKKITAAVDERDENTWPCHTSTFLRTTHTADTEMTGPFMNGSKRQRKPSRPTKVTASELIQQFKRERRRSMDRMDALRHSVHRIQTGIEKASCTPPTKDTPNPSPIISVKRHEVDQLRSEVVKCLRGLLVEQKNRRLQDTKEEITVNNEPERIPTIAKPDRQMQQIEAQHQADHAPVTTFEPVASFQKQKVVKSESEVSTEGSVQAASPLCMMPILRSSVMTKANWDRHVFRGPASPMRDRRPNNEHGTSMRNINFINLANRPASPGRRTMRPPLRPSPRRGGGSVADFIEEGITSSDVSAASSDIMSVGANTTFTAQTCGSVRRRGRPQKKHHEQLLDRINATFHGRGSRGGNRVAPQRSRSLTDLRDMLRPKSDPRRKARDHESAFLMSRVEPNPLELDADVGAGISRLDSPAIDSAPARTPSIMGKRPLARRLERHQRQSSHALQQQTGTIKPLPNGLKSVRADATENEKIEHVFRGSKDNHRQKRTMSMGQYFKKSNGLPEQWNFIVDFCASPVAA